MISDVDIRDWQQSEQEVNMSMPACGWLLAAAPFLLAAAANDYLWSRYAMVAKAVGAQSKREHAHVI
ncbi:hypothetical protein IA69_19675 [Massilia sp. JS1662]|nr:hypothetical protein [Massilia sp. JS1662]KGF80215.1 hypothetical protein IA69_19675 [Massilia sp. JS1662]